MCIRDSTTVYAESSGGLGAYAVSITVNGVRTDDDRAPVTTCLLYTSPAHETVLDLVCRLLLEKKNTCKQTIHSTTARER